MLTQKRLKLMLQYTPETGLFTWLISTSPRVRVGSTAGSINSEGYILIGIDGRIYKAHRLAWLYMNGEWPVDMLDHINHIRTDNRWCNLRECTNTQNQQNTVLRSDNTSGVIGVSWHKKSGKWVVQCGLLGMRRHFGLYEDLELAEMVAIEVRAKYHGEFANE